MRPLPVLLTRPRADSERLAGQLRAAGAGVVMVAPLIRIVPFEVGTDFDDGLIFTSLNGVEAWVAAGGRSASPTWTVGPRTAERARAAGCDVRGMASNVEALAALIPRDAPSLIHMRGVQSQGDLAGALRTRGLTVSEMVVYAQETLPLTAEALALLAAGPVLAPLYSARSAERLVAKVPFSLRARLLPICLSPAVATACGMPALAVADTPDGPSMLRAILANLDPSAVEGRGASV